jgi:glutathione S-transferase
LKLKDLPAEYIDLDEDRYSSKDDISHIKTSKMTFPRLYLIPGSCALGPHIVLREADVPFSITSIPLKDGFPDEYVHLNPKRRVPVLQIADDVAITETPAIMMAISQMAPSKHLLGKTDFEVVRTLEWMNYLSGTLHGQGFGGQFRPARYTDDESAYDGIRKKGSENIKEMFRFIDGKLEGRDWAVGDDFTAVDAYLLVFYRWGNRLGMGMRANYPNYARVIDGLCKRQSVIDTVKAEDINMLNE